VTTWGLIRTMIQRGYQLEAGPHHKDYHGFWARFTSTEIVDDAPECDDCGAPVIFERWDGAGHAETPHLAVVMAAKIALRKQVTVPPPEEFKL